MTREYEIQLVEENERFRKALEAIAAAEGPYSRDPLTFAKNVIASMTKIDEQALLPKSDAL